MASKDKRGMQKPHQNRQGGGAQRQEDERQAGQRQNERPGLRPDERGGAQR